MNCQQKLALIAVGPVLVFLWVLNVEAQRAGGVFGLLAPSATTFLVMEPFFPLDVAAGASIAVLLCPLLTLS